MIDNYFYKKPSLDDNVCYRCKAVLKYTSWSVPRDVNINEDELLEAEFDFLEGLDHHKLTEEQHEYLDAQNKAYNKNCYRDIGNALKWQDTRGYSSGNDGDILTLILCEKCTYETVGKYIRQFSYMYGNQYYHEERRQKRDDTSIKARWEKRKIEKSLNKKDKKNPTPKRKM